MAKHSYHPTPPRRKMILFPYKPLFMLLRKLRGKVLSPPMRKAAIWMKLIFFVLFLFSEIVIHTGTCLIFYKQLMEHPEWLSSTWKWSTRKSYLYVQDCIDAMLHVVEKHTAREAKHHTQVYNLGTTEFVAVSGKHFESSAMNLVLIRTAIHGRGAWMDCAIVPLSFWIQERFETQDGSLSLRFKKESLERFGGLESNPWIYGARK